MNALETIILTAAVTALANAIVVGILVHRIQKKFEAKIQTAMFEHQTKFSLSFAKTLEVLENTNSLFLGFSDAFNWFVVTYEPIKRGPGVDELLEEGKLTMKTLDIFMARVEFSAYVDSNRFFLPDEIYRKVFEVALSASILHDFAFGDFSPRSKNSKFAAFQAKLIKEMGLESLKMQRSRKIASPSNLRKIDDRIMDQADRLEELYKSVALTKE